MLVDTHAHIYDEYYDNIKNIIDMSKSNNIGLIINSGCDKKSNIEVINKSNTFLNLYCTIGIHPEYEDKYTDNDLKYIIENLNNKKVLGIGEIGLDYHYENINKERQIELFEKQLEIAKNYNLPVVVHSRDATEDTIYTLKKYPGVKGIIHSFSGSIETAFEYIKMGYKLGVGGVFTFKNSHIKEVIKKIGLDNIVLETDSPYLAPEPLRGTKNFPGNIKHIVDYLSQYLELSKEEIENKTNNNVKEIFKKIDL